MTTVTIPDKQVLRLTTDYATGHVWLLPGDEPPTCSSLDVDTFVDQLKSSKLRYAKIQLTGARVNAPLLVALYAARLAKELDLAALELCTPLCCSSRSQRQDSAEVLYAMRKWHSHPTVKGGWHEVDAADYITYGMVQNIALNDRVSEGIVELFKKHHPIWPSLSFIPTINATICAELVALIVDPRWYSHPNNPDRLSKLEAYLGLGNGRYPKHKDMVSKAWGNVDTTWTEEELEDPRNFLLRTKLSVSGTRGTDKAAKHFISFLSAAWLSVLYSNRHEPLLDPSLFFARKSEARAFKEHIAKYQQV